MLLSYKLLNAGCAEAGVSDGSKYWPMAVSYLHDSLRNLASAALSRESKVPAVKLRKPGWVAVQTAHGRGELPDGERGWD